MGQARLDEQGASITAAAVNPRRTDGGSVVDGSTVDLILELGFGTDDGDPVRGIRNALVASAAVWAVFAVAWIWTS